MPDRVPGRFLMCPDILVWRCQPIAAIVIEKAVPGIGPGLMQQTARKIREVSGYVALDFTSCERITSSSSSWYGAVSRWAT